MNIYDDALAQLIRAVRLDDFDERWLFNVFLDIIQGKEWPPLQRFLETSSRFREFDSMVARMNTIFSRNPGLLDHFIEERARRWCVNECLIRTNNAADDLFWMREEVAEAREVIMTEVQGVLNSAVS
jgi:hypothetical protein